MNIIRTILLLWLFCFSLSTASIASAATKSIYIVTDPYTYPLLDFEIKRLASDIALDTNSNVEIVMQADTPKETRDILVDAYKNNGLTGIIFIGFFQEVSAKIGTEIGSFNSYYRMLECPFGEENISPLGGAPAYETPQYYGVISACESKVWLAIIQPASKLLQSTSQWDLSGFTFQLKTYLDRNHLSRAAREREGFWFKSAFSDRGVHNANWSNIVKDINSKTELYDTNSIRVLAYDYMNANNELAELSTALESELEYLQLLTSANTREIILPGQPEGVTLTREAIEGLHVNAKIIELNSFDSRYTVNEPVSTNLYDLSYYYGSLASLLLFNGDSLLVIDNTTTEAASSTDLGNHIDFKGELEENQSFLARGNYFAQNWSNSTHKSEFTDFFIGDPTIRLRESSNLGGSLSIDNYALNARNRIKVNIGKATAKNISVEHVTIRNIGNEPLTLIRNWLFVKTSYSTVNVEGIEGEYPIFGICPSSEDYQNEDGKVVRTIMPGKETKLAIKFAPGNGIGSGSFGNVNFEALMHINTSDSEIGNFTIVAQGMHFVDSSSDNIDTDGDGIIDREDAFPSNPNEFVDTDNDCVGNNGDNDDDNDGFADEADAFPIDITEALDTDNDGVGNNADTDDDNDGVNDDSDAFPLDSRESVDTDNDGVGNNADTDDDGDGVSDSSDAYPLDSSRSAIPELNNNSEPSSGGSMSILWLLLLITIKNFYKPNVKSSRVAPQKIF